MAAKVKPRLLPSVSFIILSLLPLLISSDLNSPQNIETFYPGGIPKPSNPVTSSSSSSAHDRIIVEAVGITAATTLIVSFIFFFFVQKCSNARNGTRVERRVVHREQAMLPHNGFNSMDRNLKIVDEDGLDGVYWRKHEGRSSNRNFSRAANNREREDEDEEGEEMRYHGGRRKSGSIQESHLLGGRSPQRDAEHDEEAPPPPPPPRPPVHPLKKNPPPPPRSAPPLPPHSRNPSTLLKPGHTPHNSMSEFTSTEKRLKPLHWDKLNTDSDHSMVWGMLQKGSFRFDGNRMESLFSYNASNPKPLGRKRDSLDMDSSSPAQIFILEPHRSQNIAIVLKSLAISREEIHDALLEGQGLDADTLEKLTKIAPTQEEETEILAFNGNLTKLAFAESFLFQILKATPSAFTRLNALLFRLTYDNDILQLKESLQALESACTELRTRGLFMKLLEAILKAGNRMNAGTARGNAQAFDLTALRKLSDVKSTDGTTTLLHFVVAEVIRAEGKRRVINRNQSFNRSNSRSKIIRADSGLSSQSVAAKEEREEEYIKLGSPVVGGLSVEFLNVKNSAKIDYDGFAKACPSLRARVVEFREFLRQFNLQDGSGFVIEMKSFLETAEDELKLVEEEQIRVMELVKRTTQFYQSGPLKAEGAPPLEIFEIVKDFLDMVDRACADIARNRQKKKMATVGLAPPKSAPVRFPNLPSRFLSEKSSSSNSSSSESDSDSS